LDAGEWYVVCFGGRPYSCWFGVFRPIPECCTGACGIGCSLMFYQPCYSGGWLFPVSRPAPVHSFSFFVPLLNPPARPSLLFSALDQVFQTHPFSPLFISFFCSVTKMLGFFFLFIFKTVFLSGPPLSPPVLELQSPFHVSLEPLRSFVTPNSPLIDPVFRSFSFFFIAKHLFHPTHTCDLVCFPFPTYILTFPLKTSLVAVFSSLCSYSCTLPAHSLYSAQTPAQHLLFFSTQSFFLPPAQPLSFFGITLGICLPLTNPPTSLCPPIHVTSS